MSRLSPLLARAFASLALAAAGGAGLCSCQAPAKSQPMPEVVVLEPAAGMEKVDFRRHIAPLLQRKCVTCHYDHAPLTALSFQTREAMLEEESGRPVLVPGDAQRSTLFLVTVLPDYFVEAMPAAGHQLSKEETTRLYRWIEDGAPWPKGMVLAPEAEL